MDRNGYNKSVISDCTECFFCHSKGELVRHEVFHGSNRAKSKRLGCWVTLCPRCHDKLHKRSPEMDWELKREGQRKAMAAFSWTKQDFIDKFGRSYL